MSNDSKSTFGQINNQVSNTAESLNRIINEMVVRFTFIYENTPKLNSTSKR